MIPIVQIFNIFTNEVFILYSRFKYIYTKINKYGMKYINISIYVQNWYKAIVIIT